MKKKGWKILLLLLVCTFLLTACKKNTFANGHYVALNPPVESGEQVIQELSFKGDRVTMISGSLQQTVPYELKDGKFTIITDFGNFSYQYSEKEDGTITIDGVDYAKQ